MGSARSELGKPRFAVVLLICVRLPLIVLLAAASICAPLAVLALNSTFWQLQSVLPLKSKVITAVYLETPSDAPSAVSVDIRVSFHAWRSKGDRRTQRVGARPRRRSVGIRMS